MKLRLSILFAVLTLVSPAIAQGVAPPTVVSMTPQNGAVDVAPGRSEIRITFSEPMMDRTWSLVGGGPTFPKIEGIGYVENCTVLVVKVVLKPGWTYRYWLNSSRHQGFKNRAGVPLAQVAVTFKTSGDASDVVEKEPTGPAVTFDLEDANGVRIRSQDYAGVPIFITFGAAW